MLAITPTNLRAVPADYSDELTLLAGEAAIIVVDGYVLHPGLAELIPLPTTLVPLTSGQASTYLLTVRGYTVDQFIAIAHKLYYIQLDKQIKTSGTSSIIVRPTTLHAAYRSGHTRPVSCG